MTVDRLKDVLVFKANNLMHMHVKRGNMVDACHVFDNMPKRDVMSWNIMITGYAKQDEGAWALELYVRMRQEGVPPSERTFIGALKACSSLVIQGEGKQGDGKGCLEKGRAIHSQVIESGFESDVFVGTNIVDMHAKCRSMEDAWHVFCGLPHRNVVTWTTMILAYAKHGDGARALKLYAQMHQEDVKPNARVFVGASKACSNIAKPDEGQRSDGKFANLGCLEKGRAIHSQVVNGGFESDVFLGSTLVDMYVKCGNMEDAQCVFDKLPNCNVATWTAMILGYSKHIEGACALKSYTQMHQEGVQPNARTFVGALKACYSLAALDKKQGDKKLAKAGCLKKGRTIHVDIVKSGFESDIFVGNTLVDMYMKGGSLEDARCVFDEMSHRNVVTWSNMILGYSKQEEGVLALEMYSWMQQEGVKPTSQTFVGALKACISLAALEEGKQLNRKCVKRGSLEKSRAIHFQVAKSGFVCDVFIATTLLHVYVKCGSMEDAQRVFDELPHRDVVTWTTMIQGHAQQEDAVLALALYAKMQQEGVQPNDQTFVGILKACGSLAALEEGKLVDGKIVKSGCLDKGRAVHSQIVKSGFESDIFVGNTLVDVYAKCGCLEDARHVFDKLPHCDAISWNAMILRYAVNEENQEAFRLYVQMQEKGISPNSFTFVAILKSCGNTVALENGKELHSQISRAGLESIAIVATNLIDMYAKCGSMVDAQQLFNALPTKDVVQWSALIAGYAWKGDYELAFHLFDIMQKEGIQPDGVTFLTVLSVCSHVGLVDKGYDYFQIMSKQYLIIPTIEHYTCMVDLLGRAGQVAKAMAMVEKMPFQPNVVIWSTVLGACQKWKNVEIGRHAFENAIRLDYLHPAAYVLMGNIYADAYLCEDYE